MLDTACEPCTLTYMASPLHTDLTALSPVEIDTELSKLWETIQTFAGHIGATRRYLETEQARTNPNERRIAEYEAHIAGYRAKVAAARAEAAPYEAEYVRRGRWNRYFLVTNSNGHVHRGMNCGTCYQTTTYAWLIELADCDEAAMVTEFGEKACTVCFPDAPAHPSFSGPGRRDAAAKAERAAEKAARDAVKAAKGLAPEFQFTFVDSWRGKVTTLAAAKEALRDAVSISVIAGTTADANGYYAGRLAKSVEVFNLARHALEAKGLGEAEIAKIVANATKKTKKDYNLA